MNSKLIEIRVDDSTKIYLEVPNDPNPNQTSIEMPAASDNVYIQKTKDFFENVCHQIKAFSGGISSALNDFESSPDELELELAIKFSADAGIIFSSLTSEISSTMKMVWKKQR